MSTKTDICNLALGHLNAQTMTNVDSEKSTEAMACRMWYDLMLEATLRDFPFPFAKASVSLGLVGNNPNREWLFSYRYPSDCISFLKIDSGFAVDSQDTRVPFTLSSDASGGLIYTNQENAVGVYMTRAFDTARMTADFVIAFSLRLAAVIAPKVTGGDPFKLGAQAYQAYQIEIDRAKVNAAEEEQKDKPADSEFISVR